MHDVDDHKYSEQENPNYIRDLVIKFGGNPEFAAQINENT